MAVVVNKALGQDNFEIVQLLPFPPRYGGLHGVRVRGGRPGLQQLRLRTRLLCQEFVSTMDKF